jgi:hypothetical protein
MSYITKFPKEINDIIFDNYLNNIYFRNKFNNVIKQLNFFINRKIILSFLDQRFHFYLIYKEFNFLSNKNCSQFILSHTENIGLIEKYTIFHNSYNNIKKIIFYPKIMI